MTSQKSGPYRQLWQELGRRTKTPFLDLTFVIYVFLGVLLFGGLGVWSEVFTNLIRKDWQWDTVIHALSTYYPALIGAATIQLILEANRQEQRIFDRPLTAFSLLILLGSILSGILIRVFEATSTFSNFCFWGTCVLTILGIWIWVVANCDNPDLKTDPSAASGGDPTRPLKGNLEGFKV